MATMSPEVSLAVFGHQTALFQRYANYRKNRMSPVTYDPLPEPITEFREALVLLYEGRGSSQHRIKTDGKRFDGSSGPVLVIGQYGGGYGKCEHTGDDVFAITPELLTELQEAGVLLGTPHMGYTDDTELSLNATGVERLLEEVKAYAQEQPSS